jgi:hypothetical protein
MLIILEQMMTKTFSIICLFYLPYLGKSFTFNSFVRLSALRIKSTQDDFSNEKATTNTIAMKNQKLLIEAQRLREEAELMEKEFNVSDKIDTSDFSIRDFISNSAQKLNKTGVFSSAVDMNVTNTKQDTAGVKILTNRLEDMKQRQSILNKIKGPRKESNSKEESMKKSSTNDKLPNAESQKAKPKGVNGLWLSFSKVPFDKMERFLHNIYAKSQKSGKTYIPTFDEFIDMATLSWLYKLLKPAFFFYQNEGNAISDFSFKIFVAIKVISTPSPLNDTDSMVNNDSYDTNDIFQYHIDTLIMNSSSGQSIRWNRSRCN